MKPLLHRRRKAFRSRRAQALVEYALILVLVAMIALVGLTRMKEAEANTLGTINNSIGSVMGNAGLNGDVEPQED